MDLLPPSGRRLCALRDRGACTADLGGSTGCSSLQSLRAASCEPLCSPASRPCAFCRALLLARASHSANLGRPSHRHSPAQFRHAALDLPSTCPPPLLLDRCFGSLARAPGCPRSGRSPPRTRWTTAAPSASGSPSTATLGEEPAPAALPSRAFSGGASSDWQVPHMPPSNCRSAEFDFSGTGPEVFANHNAPPAVTYRQVATPVPVCRTPRLAPTRSRFRCCCTYPSFGHPTQTCLPDLRHLIGLGILGLPMARALGVEPEDPVVPLPAVPLSMPCAAWCGRRYRSTRAVWRPFGSPSLRTASSIRDRGRPWWGATSSPHSGSRTLSSRRFWRPLQVRVGTWIDWGIVTCSAASKSFRVRRAPEISSPGGTVPQGCGGASALSLCTG